MAGQSIRDEKERLTDNRLIPLYFGTAFLWVLWGWEKFKDANHLPPQPRFFLWIAVVATFVSAIVLFRLVKRFRNLNRGERGEIKVAELLDELRVFGYRVIPDITRDGFNIDHVVVGPAGVFVVETKYRGGYGVIEFRSGEGLFVGGRKEENDPLAQARGNAAEVNLMIKEDCGVYKWVTPLVVFVGDYQIKNNWQSTDLRVFTADQVVRYIREQQPELTRSEIELIASHLERTTSS
jgi:nuclease-like protein